MAKDQAENEPETNEPTQPDDGADDGYKRSRRQQARGAAEPAEKPKPRPKLSSYDAFMEEHWESWLRPVGLLFLIAVFYLTYTWHLLPESMAGILAAGGIVGGAIYAAALPTYELIQSNRHRALFVLLVAAWAFSSGYPTLRKAVPRQTLGEAVLTEANKTQKLNLASSTGPYDLTVSGKIKPSGTQFATASYEITASGGGGTDTVSGELEYSVHQTRGRRGSSGHWTENHDQVVHRLSRSVSGHELTLSVDSISEQLEDGLHILLHPQGIDPLIFWSLGVLVLLIMIFVETKIGDAKDKTHLVMAAAVTLVFAWRFYQRATPANLVRPALDALLLSVLTAGPIGTLVGWLARRLSGRDKLRPKPDKSKRRDSDED